MNRHPQENIPQSTVVKFNFGRLWISILVQDRFDIERRKYTGDDNVQGPEGKGTARTGPRDTVIHYVGSVTNISYLLPDPNTLSSGLNTRGFISPSFRNLSGLKVSGSG